MSAPIRPLPDQGWMKFGAALCREAGVDPSKCTGWVADTTKASDPDDVVVVFTVHHVMSIDRFNEVIAAAAAGTGTP